MADATPTTPLVFESAVLTSPAPVDGAPLHLRDRSSTTKTLVRSDRDQFGGLAFGRSTMVADAIVAATRPDEWLILGDPGAVEAAAADVDRGGFTSVVPFTHGRAMFEVTGADASRLLEKVCGIDWSDSMTPDGAVVSASVALVTCDVIRHDRDTTPSYVLVCDRSFGQYLFHALLDAGSEFGIAVG